MNYFFNCDWGTTHFRLRLVQASSGAIIGQRASDEGAAKLATLSTPENRAQAFQKVLDHHVNELLQGSDADLRQAPILISGMASSSIGWRELPYATLPFALDGRDLHWQCIEPAESEGADPPIERPIYLLSGVRGKRDVMRGEEVELLGLGLLKPEFCQLDRALVLLPGTHSKHIWLSRGKIIDFQTHMTGELFDLLSQRSSLRHPDQQPNALADATDHPLRCETAFCEEAFCEGVELARQGSLTSTLFQVRTGQVLQDDDAPTSAALLSGMLIGSELAPLARREKIQNTPIILCAGRRLSEKYQTALAALGLTHSLRVIPPAEVERLSALGQLVALQQIQPREAPQHTTVLPLDAVRNDDPHN